MTADNLMFGFIFGGFALCLAAFRSALRDRRQDDRGNGSKFTDAVAAKKRGKCPNSGGACHA
jgi:hypothetical protein